MVLSTSFKRAQAGVTVLELALCIMLLGIVSVAVSSLVKTGMESQMSQRTHETMQAVALNIMDDLRFDLRTAEKAACLGAPSVVAQISSAGNRLDFCNQTGRVTYQLSANRMSRTAEGVTKTYNDTEPALNVLCPTGCFQVVNGQLKIPDLRVQQPTAGNTIIDQWFASADDPAFGLPTYRMSNASFALISATQFQ